jgi:FKBP-type peptidyl-prolyl cis-trans isomerase FkpA
MSKTQRIIWLAIALVFVGSSIGFSGLTIWQAQKDRENQNIEKGLQEALGHQQTNQIPKEEGKLQGTKLGEFTPTASVTTLQTTDLKIGDGAEAKAGSTVVAHYTGALASDGTIFQSSLDTGQPATFGLDQVIKGWTQGVPGMKVGGKRRLIIPAELAYGANPPSGSGIPANAPLVFDIELFEVK